MLPHKILLTAHIHVIYNKALKLDVTFLVTMISQTAIYRYFQATTFSSQEVKK